MKNVSVVVALVLCCGGVRGQEPNITRCTTGAANISRKAFHVQVCNLFGGTCIVNHPDISDCATEALSIATGECKLYPIFEYEDNFMRSTSPELLSTQTDLGCSIFIQDGAARMSGACMAVQCDLGTAWAGPGMTGDSPPTRSTGVTDTATATWQTWSLASIDDDAKQLKNVFLYRTGNYVATTRRVYTWNSGGVTLSVGKLPTSNGNNYGPVACPSVGNLLTSSVATALSAEDMKMCGATGKWVYFNAINLLLDSNLFASYSKDSTAAATANDLSMAQVPFLDGRSGFRSSDRMADPRAVKLHSGTTISTDVLMTSETIQPQADGAATGETAGTWRNYGVVFYCDDYARTDLTTCAEANRKMFYVADPNPLEQFGSSASNMGGDASINDSYRAKVGMMSGSMALFFTAFAF